MSETPREPDQPVPVVTHHKSETIIADYEKVIVAMAPLAEKLSPLVEAWRGGEAAKVKAAESGANARQLMTSVSLILVVACVAGLACVAIVNNQAATAEKIVIGLLAFLGGVGVRR